MNLKFLGTIFLSLSIFLYSCTEDIDIHNISGGVNLHPALIVPLGGASFTLGDMLTNFLTDIKFETTDGIEISHVSLDSAEYKLPVIDFLKNATQHSQNFYPSPVGTRLIPPNEDLPALMTSDFFNLGINSNPDVERIDSAKIRSAILKVSIHVSEELKSIDLSKFKVTISFPAGNIRMLDGSLNPSFPFTPLAFEQEMDLPMSDFVMNTSGNVTGIPMDIKIEAKTGDVPITLTSNSAITCILKFSELNYSVVYGFFNPDIIPSIGLRRNINLIKIFPDGLLKFSNPQLTITVMSNIGAYINFKIEYIKAFNNAHEDKAVFAWFENHSTNSFNFQLDKKPVVPGSWETFPLRTLDKSWGETHTLFENTNKPDILEYRFSASIDQALIKADPSPNFLTPDAMVKVRIKTTIPFYLNEGSYYNFQDTIPNIFETLANTFQNYPTDMTDSVSLILNVKNGFPFKTKLSIRLLDLRGNEIQNNFIKDYNIKAGAVDATGLVEKGGESNQILSIPVTNEHLQDLRKTNSIVYILSIDGENMNSKFHFTTLNTFDLKVGLRIHGKISKSL